MWGSPGCFLSERKRFFERCIQRITYKNLPPGQVGDSLEIDLDKQHTACHEQEKKVGQGERKDVR